MIKLPSDVEDIIYNRAINGESRASVVSYLKSIGYDTVDETQVSFLLEINQKGL